MTPNILKILVVAGKEDVISNLLKYAIDNSAIFKEHFLKEICGINDATKDDFCKTVTRVAAGVTGIPDIIICRKGKCQADLIVIENKLKADEGFEQTSRYASAECISALKNNQQLQIPPDAPEHFIYLTLFDDEVPKEENKFIPKRYSDLLSILERLPFEEGKITDQLLWDLKEILSEFYSFGETSTEDCLLEKFKKDSTLDGPYLYFSRILSELLSTDII